MRLPKPIKEVPIHEWTRVSGGSFKQIGNPALEYDSQDEGHIYYIATTVPTPQSGTSWPAGFVVGTKCRTLDYMKSGGTSVAAEFDESYKIEAEINGTWVTLGRYNYSSDPFGGGDFNAEIESYVFYTTEIEKFESELEALNAIADDIAVIKTNTATANGHLSTIKEYLNASNALQTSANTTMTALRGAVVDVKNVPTDACIIRIYVGDITAKREKASEKVTELLTAGYRPYMVMGISEDLARVLFVKYPAPNDTPVI